MGSAARKLLAVQPAAGGGGAFNPETDITWHSLFWAEGTDFVAQGYSDTNTVTTWPNETTEKDLTGSSGTPEYVASDTNLNNKPSVQYVAADNEDSGTAASWTADPSYTSGVSFVIVCVIDSTGNRTVVDGEFFSGENRVGITSTPEWFLDAGGTAQNGGTPTTGAHLLVAQFDGSTGNDTLHVNGTLTVNADSGSKTINGLVIGNAASGANSSDWDGSVAFVGIYEGDFTADGSYADFVTWAETHYGLTIA